MHKLILWYRLVRRNAIFKTFVRGVFVFLIILGAWVATRNLDFPDSIALSDKVKHIIVFWGFAVLIDMTSSRHPFWLWKAIPLVFYGLIIEILQYFSADRTFSLLDWVADIFGILLYFIGKVIIVWLDSKRNPNG